jgi:prophage regulatory protein
MHSISRDCIAADWRRSLAKILLRRKQVQERVNLSRSELYRLMSLGRFPRAVPLGERVVAWDADEIEVFIRGRIAARDAKAAQKGAA